MPTSAGDRGSWLRRYHRAAPDAHRLVVFPHAGGSASFYFPLSAALAPAVEVLAVQYPGRQDRGAEPLVDDVAELADRIAPVVAGEADRPLALFGHSLGASIAFEVAGRLEREYGVEPRHVFVSGRRAPSRNRDGQLHLLDDAGLVAEMRSLQGTDGSILDDEELLALLLPVIRNDYRAAETYRWRGTPALAAPVTALTGDADPRVDRADAEAWREHTTGEFALHAYPGGHFFLVDHQRDVVGLVERTLRVSTSMG